jgi:hypothetical protein
MNPPFTLIKPNAVRVPLVLDSPHSGTEYPDDFRARVTREQLRQAEDSFVDELYASGPVSGATLIAARFPRSYIDPNRSFLDIDASSTMRVAGPGDSQPQDAVGDRPHQRLFDTGGRSMAQADRGRGEATNRELSPAVQRAVKDALDGRSTISAPWAHQLPLDVRAFGRRVEEGRERRAPISCSAIATHHASRLHRSSPRR